MNFKKADGVILNSTNHPSTSFIKQILLRIKLFFIAGLSEKALENLEIEVPEKEKKNEF